MKTAAEFASMGPWSFLPDGPAAQMLEARDAAHADILDKVRAALADVLTERDRLKGELTEARRLIELGIANSGLWPELRAKYRAFLAAPSPAESTGVPGPDGVAAKWLALQAKMPAAETDVCQREHCGHGRHQHRGASCDHINAFEFHDCPCEGFVGSQLTVADMALNIAREAAAAPPDDIRDLLGDAEVDIRILYRHQDDHERRLNVLANQVRMLSDRIDPLVAKELLAPAAPQEQAGHAMHRCTRPKCAGWKEMEPDEREGLDERTFCDAEESSASGGPCPRGQCATDSSWHKDCQK